MHDITILVYPILVCACLKTLSGWLSFVLVISCVSHHAMSSNNPPACWGSIFLDIWFPLWLCLDEIAHNVHCSHCQFCQERNPNEHAPDISLMTLSRVYKTTHGTIHV